MSNREAWTDLHHLAYVYAAIASVDGSISKDELEVFCQKLHEWRRDVDLDELMPLVLEAVSALGEDQERGDLQQLTASVAVAARVLDAESRATALDDLLAIAAADGKLLPGEGEFLLMVRKAWQVDQAPRARRGLEDPAAGRDPDAAG